jgi:hypothetical protein
VLLRPIAEVVVGRGSVYGFCVFAILTGIAVPNVAIDHSREARAQQPATRTHVVAPETASVDEEIVVEVLVDEVENLGGFQFVLTVDPDVLEPLSVDKGLFLGSSGREVVCNDPTIDGAAVQFLCVTLGPTPDGPSGTGAVASVTFLARGKGDSELNLTRVRLAHPDGTPISSSSSGTSISVNGSSEANRLLYVGIGVGALVVLLAAAAIAIRRARVRRATSPPPSDSLF